jgi:hypothetical protein
MLFALTLACGAPSSPPPTPAPAPSAPAAAPAPVPSPEPAPELAATLPPGFPTEWRHVTVRLGKQLIETPCAGTVPAIAFADGHVTYTGPDGQTHVYDVLRVFQTRHAWVITAQDAVRTPFTFRWSLDDPHRGEADGPLGDGQPFADPGDVAALPRGKQPAEECKRL